MFSRVQDIEVLPEHSWVIPCNTDRCWAHRIIPILCTISTAQIGIFERFPGKVVEGSVCDFEAPNILGAA